MWGPPQDQREEQREQGPAHPGGKWRGGGVLGGRGEAGERGRKGGLSWPAGAHRGACVAVSLGLFLALSCLLGSGYKVAEILNHWHLAPLLLQEALPQRCVR